MLRVSDSGRTRWVRTLPLIAIMAVMVMGTFPAAGASSLAPSTAPSGNHVVTVPTTPTAAPPISSSSAGAALKTAASTKSLNPHPSSFSPSNVSLTFYQNTSSFAVPSASEAGCTISNPYGYEIQDICNQQAYDPSAVTLANGNVGVGYTVTTNVTGTSTSGCIAGPTNSTVQERVGFSISSDNGTSFGPINFLGNETCSYLDAIEPSFAVGPSGTVYGTYVEENFSGQTGFYTDDYNLTSSGYSCIYGYYGACQNRSADALGFTVSTDNGVTFSAPVTISTVGWIAHPQIAVFGDSVYVLYENIDNYTGTLLPYGYTYYTAPPISLELLYSKDGGATWKGPYGIPGITGVSGIAQAMGGAIAVNATGTVAVSYFTDDNCAAIYYGYCYSEALNLALATSTTNGSSFLAPYVLSGDWGTTYPYWSPYYGDNYGSNFENLPQSAIALSPNGQTVYIGWTAPYNETALFGVSYPPYELYEGESGAFEATGTIKGVGFAINILMATSEDYNDQYAYSLAIGANAGGVYVTYSGFNSSYCYGSSCSYIGNTYFEGIQTSTNGVSWSGPAFPTFVQTNQCVYCVANDYPGIYSSVAFTASGAPVYAYSLPNQETTSYNFGVYPYYYNATYPTDLYVATNYSGPTLSLNITESGIASGSSWSVSVDGALISVPAGVQNFTLSGVAIDQTIFFSAPNLAVVALEVASAVITVTGGQAYEGAASFTGNGTVFVNYTYEYGIQFIWEPSNILDGEIESVPCCNYYYYVDNFCTPACTYSYPSFPPWYFAMGSTEEWQGYGDPVDAQFWSGTGNGSYTGPGMDANVTMNGPITEIVWFVPVGEYNITVQAPTLPTTSTFSFSFDGIQYSATGGSTVTVPNVQTGAHYFTNVSATTTTSGWTYIGTLSDYLPQLVPNSLLFNLSFVLVDTSAPAGQVSFQAQGFTSGTPWQFQFNGSTYSSSTPWINISSRPGTFTTSASPAVSANGSVGYVPLNVPATWSVTTGMTYTVNYTQAYRVTALAGSGGSVSGGTPGGVTWVQSGGVVSFQESAHSGYVFNGWAGTGLGAYTGTGPYANLTVGGPITETASFVPLPNSRFNLTFQETGLAVGTLWTAFVGGIGYSGTGTTIVVHDLLACGQPGANYNISVPTVYASNDATRYVGTSSIPKTQCTTGVTIVKQTFAPQYYVSVQSTPGGYATATLGSTTTDTGFWVPAGDTVGLDAYVQPGYDFLGWNGTGLGNYTGTLQIDTIVVAGPVLEVAAFAQPVVPPPTVYWIDFTLSTPLAAGTAWTVTVQGTGYTSTGSSLLVPGLSPGTYQLGYPTAYTSDGLTKYTSAGAPSSVSLTANKTLSIGYTTSYWVTVSAGAGGTIVTPTTASAWILSGSTVTLNATPNAGYVFLGWTGTGSSSYTGPSSTDVLQVRSPVTEVASFEIPPVTPSTTTTGTSFFAEPIAWIGLGIVGLLVGLVVGILVSRRGRSPPPTGYSPAPEAPAPETDSTTYGSGGSS